MGMGFGGRIRNAVAGKRGGIGAADNMALALEGTAAATVTLDQDPQAPFDFTRMYFGTALASALAVN